MPNLALSAQQKKGTKLHIIILDRWPLRARGHQNIKKDEYVNILKRFMNSRLQEKRFSLPRPIRLGNIIKIAELQRSKRASGAPKLKKNGQPNQPRKFGYRVMAVRFYICTSVHTEMETK